ncbi:sensor domain-containing diguanylate cyclase [Erythrobacter sp. HKB08]|uniref:GGDEF domain-containing protein n=1 Tax=Erythrobacter sp. HKB08 TaxID=2502843 RepID=UPI0013E89E49|nr:sensor domain-containing diguanylate cyclase [Erythrobacter sp. HKB08]
MGDLGFAKRELRALYGLLADSSEDIVFTADRRGFVVQAQRSFEALGFALGDLLIGPHVLDLAEPATADPLASSLRATLKGRQLGCEGEFRARRVGQWFRFRLRAIGDGQGGVCGVLGHLRNIEQAKRLEERVFKSEMTDPLTEATNRRAFLSMLGHLVERGSGGTLALVAIDGLRQVNRKHGLTEGDRLLVAFADFLRGTMPNCTTISRASSDSFGLLMPMMSQDEATGWATHLVEKWRGLGSRDSAQPTISIGLAEIGASLDVTLNNAELALKLAKAKGGNTVEPAGERLSRRRMMRIPARAIPLGG